jgi:uncharacterized membrane protein YeaQ/YmgE (transglycosylase-associated protein family)
MDVLFWLLIAGLIGWIASSVMGTNAQQGLLLNIFVGIISPFLASVLLSPVLEISTINQNDFSLPSLLTSLSSAIILSAVVNPFRQPQSSGATREKTKKENAMGAIEYSNGTTLPDPNPPHPPSPIPDPLPPAPNPPSPPRPPQPPDPTPPAQL